MRLGIFAAAVIAAVAMSGNKLAAAPTELEFATSQMEEPGSGDWWKQVIPAFEAAHPEVHVTVTNIPFVNFLDQMTIRFASGRPPGVMTLLPVNVGQFASQDWLQPLDDRIKGTPIGGPSWTTLQKEETWDGKTMGVLLSTGPDMLFYNKKMLQDAGVALPKSYDEFVAAVNKLTNREKGIYGLSSVTTEHTQIGFDLLEHIEWQGLDAVKDGKYNFTDPAVVAAVDKWRNMVMKNSALGLNSTMNRQLFADGKAAFMFAGPWIWPVVEKEPKDVQANEDLIATPFKRTLGGGLVGLHIPAGLDKATQDAAWSFIEFAIQPQWEQRLAFLDDTLPALQVALPKEALDSSKPVYRAMMAANIDVSPRIPLVRAIRANDGDFNDICVKAAVRMLSTTTPTADILKDLQNKLEQSFPLN
jgi:ABC-type glycerol-3-phosphate transport system substrate-binding protein